ncbi:hypothetical protein [Curtobacterium sp. 24E2]
MYAVVGAGYPSSTSANATSESPSHSPIPCLPTGSKPSGTDTSALSASDGPGGYPVIRSA